MREKARGREEGREEEGKGSVGPRHHPSLQQAAGAAAPRCRSVPVPPGLPVLPAAPGKARVSLGAAPCPWPGAASAARPSR